MAVKDGRRPNSPGGHLARVLPICRWQIALAGRDGWVLSGNHDGSGYSPQRLRS